MVVMRWGCCEALKQPCLAASGSILRVAGGGILPYLAVCGSSMLTASADPKTFMVTCYDSAAVSGCDWTRACAEYSLC